MTVWGVIFAVIKDWSAKRNKKNARCEQIAFIHDRISDGFTWAGKFRASDPVGAHYRYQNFQYFLEDLQIIVEHQADSLSTAEHGALRRALFRVRRSADLLGQRGYHPTGSTWYQAMYDNFVELDWLGLEEYLSWE